jgi:putative glycosyltransferase (TIGR04348 family)
VRISLVTPAASGSQHGNRVTAERWASLLGDAGHEVVVEEAWAAGDADLMLALHARRSHHSIGAYARAHPERPLVVALTGTDLYRDIGADGRVEESLALATRLIVLQERALDELDGRHRGRGRVVVQSAPRVERRAPAPGQPLDALVVGHLRAVKDPFRAALAARLLPERSAVRVIQAGGAREEGLAAGARALERSVPRYRWLEEVPHDGVRELMSRAWALVHPSLVEGGANAVSEAIAASLPVLASRIPGNVGLLGEDHPGYFPPGDESALADLITRAESDGGLYRALAETSTARGSLVTPAAERAALVAVLEEAAAAGDAGAAAYP